MFALRSRRMRWVGLAAVVAVASVLIARRDDLFEKRVRVVAEGKLIRGAWQRPGPLRRIVEREGIRTVVTLTAINRDDPKYVAQEPVLREAGVDWIIVPMHGSTATLAEMAEAADLLADPARQPVFFHCVGGHHRTGLVHAAYRIRHQGWSAERAWSELAALPWTRPGEGRDRQDRRLIEAFAKAEAARRAGENEQEEADGEGVADHPAGDPQGDSTLGARPAGGGAGDRLAGRLPADQR